jgi:hypothetical protein
MEQQGNNVNTPPMPGMTDEGQTKGFHLGALVMVLG